MAIEGWLEFVSEYGASGWAFDPENPGAHHTVSIRRGNRLIGETRCNLFRTDLLAANIGRGDHAFVYNFATAIARRDIGDISASIAGETLPVFDSTSAPTDGGPAPLIRRTLAADFRPQEAAPAGLPAAYPVFVLGSVRSGTSAIASALTSGTRYVGFREGLLFDLILRLRSCIAGFYSEREANLENDAVMIRHVPEKFVLDLVSSVFRNLASEIFSSAHWVDKTPTVDMISLTPTLARIWPEAKFIFMKRRGIENMLSRLRKFPDSIAFRSHCADWTAAMEAWETVRPSLGVNALEIDQKEMLSRPDDVARRVGIFLELDETERTALGTHLHDRTLERTANYDADTPDISETGWSSEQIAIFRDICGTTMRKFGYGFGKSYFEGAASIHRTAACQPNPG
jgi:hypothetical protein